jgi:hypothetical protein
MGHGQMRLPKHVQAYVTPWGKQVYYLRKPGRPKIRIHVADDVPPWSPAFMAALEAASAKLPADPKQIFNRAPVAGTINAALIGYYDSAAFKALGETTQQSRRAILERLIRAEHGDKRTIMMHAKAVQTITSKLKPKPAAQFQEGDASFRPLLHQPRTDDGRSVRLGDADRQAEVKGFPCLER